MSIEEITEWLWKHPPERCDEVDAAIRRDLCEQVAEIVALVAQQARARQIRPAVRLCQ